MTFARVTRESGLTPSELAKLYGVSRQSVHNWINNGPPDAGIPGAAGLLGRQAATITAALENAIDKKILPFGAIDKEKRKERIARMAARLQNLSPAPAAK